MLELRDGRRVSADAITGSLQGGLVVATDSGSRSIAVGEVLAVLHGEAAAPELLRVELAGGDRLHGAIVGGDEAGDTLSLLSPVLGRLDLWIDRIAAIVQPGVHLGDQRMPDGVDEAVFLPTGRGFDLVAGTLHRFGTQGVRFQADGADEPRWYAPRQISSLQLRSALPREEAAGCLLVTRVADRVAVDFDRCTAEGVELRLETGARVKVAWRDVACLLFDAGVVHLADLTPVEVVESGYDSEVSWSWRRDAAVTGGELLAKRRAYGRGLGVHSRSRLTFRVPAGAERFHARVAIDDSTLALPLQPHAVARVLRGNAVLFEVDDLTPGREPLDVGVHPVEPGDTITLEVDFGRGRDLGDRVDWLLPVFLLRERS